MVAFGVVAILGGEKSYKALMDEKIQVFIRPLRKRGPTSFVIQNVVVSVVGGFGNESEDRTIN